jgi:hypothetical protein
MCAKKTFVGVEVFEKRFTGTHTRGHNIRKEGVPVFIIIDFKGRGHS